VTCAEAVPVRSWPGRSGGQPQASNDALSSAQATRAVEDLLELPVLVFSTTPLIRRIWALRDNLNPYDACYVALAEALGCSLVTADRRLANAPGGRHSVR
jgi:predicted nucleic acid-binding protein